MRSPRSRHVPLAATVLLLLAGTLAAAPTGDYVVLGWNDLGMHCMNRYHARFSILPPYNTLWAQVIRRGDASTPPQIVTSGVTLAYSIPGNTYSVGKTDFWTYDRQLFGVDLPDDVGLKGKGLTGTLDPSGTGFVAEGIPLTPFRDDDWNHESPYQQARLDLRDGGGNLLFTSNPVLPVSTEVNCVSSGCHGSEQAILEGHDDEGGFDPGAIPILCAGCHGDPILGTSPVGEASYFSYRIHKAHDFIDRTIPGKAGCERCHPGPQTRCLRGTMATDHGMICQDCHGNMQRMHSSIASGRIPWLEEPACRTCHTSQFGEPAGQLYRNSTGHGGVRCEGCHGTPHAILPSREPADNADNLDLQGHAGVLDDCTVCHRVVPEGAGPHGIQGTTAVEMELTRDAGRLLVFPSPLSRGATCTVKSLNGVSPAGRLLVFDAAGRTIRLLRTGGDGEGHLLATWDGRDRRGTPVPTGVYFLRWDDGRRRATGKVLVVE